MKIAIVQISDLHVKDKDNFLPEKINHFFDTYNLFGQIDQMCIVFSGDLAYSGKKNEYKKARFLINKVITNSRPFVGGKHVPFIAVPGNHDMCFPETTRERKDIQAAYDNSTIEELIDNELSFLNNYYNFQFTKNCANENKLFNKIIYPFGDFKIQFNLINTAIFSTLEPNDKELHYFPLEKLDMLKKGENVDLCVTVMHHDISFFHWKYLHKLEERINESTDLLLLGHEHYQTSKQIAVNSNTPSLQYYAGSMDFTSYDHRSSFNFFIIDTEEKSIQANSFEWSKTYFAKTSGPKSYPILKARNTLCPRIDFLTELKNDENNAEDDFSAYFVFPLLVCNKYDKTDQFDKVQSIEKFLEVLTSKKKIVILGSSNSGKSTLLKYIYSYLSADKMPLFLRIEPSMRFKQERIIRDLFNEQYGGNDNTYELFLQNKEKRVLIVDSIDQIANDKSREKFLQYIEGVFDYIIISSNSNSRDFISSIIERIDEDKEEYVELRIKPFFGSRRNELIEKVCIAKHNEKDAEIARITGLMNSIIRNNNNLFTLNPGFIIKYTDYFVHDKDYEYTKGEAIFSRVFEYEIQHTIAITCGKKNMDEILVVLEEIAGTMFSQKKDILSQNDIWETIRIYNSEYGLLIDQISILSDIYKTKLLCKTNDQQVYFSNKNYLAYFIAKYLFRKSQGEDQDNTGIMYTLKNICFGINSDIVLFLSYLSNSPQILIAIKNHAEEIFADWEKLDLESEVSASFFGYDFPNITLPKLEEKKALDSAAETIEEANYVEDIIEAKGFFDYDENTISSDENKLICAFEYTEMLCKALPGFNTTLKLKNKMELIDFIFDYPSKILQNKTFGLMVNHKNIALAILNFISNPESKIHYGDNVDLKKIQAMLQESVQADILGTMDHFAELCSTIKTLPVIEKKEVISANEKLQRLLMIENAGNTDQLIKYGEQLLKEFKKAYLQGMVRLIIRKHVLRNGSLSQSKLNEICDKFFVARLKR